MTIENELERNVRYVVKVLKENPTKKGHGLFYLVMKTRLAHSKDNLLSSKDARDAITEAENRGLIVKITGYIVDRYFLNK